MATVDHAGNIFTMEAYTAQTTNGSGEITVTLQNTPTSDNAIIVQCQGVTGAFAEFKSRSGTAVTVIVRRDYEMVDETTGSAVALPGGVTSTGAAITVSGTTSSFSATNRGNNPGNNATDSHSHTFSDSVTQVITHSHDTAATLISPLASTGGLTIVVAYAF